jgi:hypothetical protein
MTQLALVLPVVGQLNSVADPAIASDLTQIQNVVNGNLDTTNIANGAGITPAQLSSVVLSLADVSTPGNYTAAAGQFVYAYGPPQTITLPVVTSGVAFIAVKANNADGTHRVTVATSGGAQFLGGGCSGQTTMVLGNNDNCVLLLGDGTRWNVLAGVTDTGWVNTTGWPFLATNVGVSGGTFTTACRVEGSQVRFKGALYNNTGSSIAANATLASLPTLFYPSNQANLSASAAGTAGYVQITNGGVVSFTNTFPNGAMLSLDGLRYSLVDS